MEGISSNTGRKVYPKRIRITREDAVTNILNWLDDSNEDALSSSDQESEDENEETSTSSESEYEENESTVSMKEVVRNEEPVEDLDNTNSDYEDTEVGNKQKRGRPKGTSTANKNQQREQPDENVDECNEVVGDNDLRLHEFRFIPAKEPGVQAQLDESSSALRCFFELFDEEVQLNLVKLTNEFATYAIQQNNPCRRRSKYSKWYPITRYELLKLFAVLIAMGIERRPNLYDYWSISGFNYTPWYHKLFLRGIFETLYSTMLHVNSIGDEKSKKDKIEPFLNKLL